MLPVLYLLGRLYNYVLSLFPNNYSRIATICIAVYFSSQFLPQADGTWFYAIQGCWSSFVFLSVLEIQRSRLTFTIAGIEYCAVLLNLLACFGYLTSIDFYYRNYPAILTALNVTELIVLIIGAPWHGILTRFQSLRSLTDNRAASEHRASQANKLLSGEEWRIQG